MGSDPQYATYPELSLAQHIFHLTNPSSGADSRQASLKILQDAILKHKMAPLYRYLAHPTEGVLNPGGEGRSQSSPSSRQAPSSAMTGIVVSQNGMTDVEFPWEEGLYEQLKKDNEKELEELEKEEVEAAEKAGETEVQAAKGKRAEFWARVGDKVRRNQQFS